MGKELERLRPQEQALVRVAKELDIVQLSDDGRAMVIDLSSPKLAENYNVLYPAAALMPTDPNFTPSLNIVRIDPDPDHGDVYPIESEGYGKNKKMKAGALLKTAVEKLGEAAGLVELPPVWDRRGKDLHVICGLKARRSDGTFKPVYGSREWIHDDEYEKVVNACPKTEYKSDQPLSPEKRDEWIRKNWARVKEFREPMIESKAYLRAYRKALKLKAKYTPDELRKPFLVVSTLFTPDTSDIRILGMLMTGGQEAANTLYGEPRQLEAGSEDVESFEVMEGDDAPTGVDTETGEIIEGEVVEEAETEADAPATFGEKPETDLEIPRGPHKGKMLSELVRTERKYVEETILKSSNPSWGMCAEAWLKHVYGEGGGDDIDFG